MQGVNQSFFLRSLDLELDGSWADSFLELCEAVRNYGSEAGSGGVGDVGSGYPGNPGIACPVPVRFHKLAHCSLVNSLIV